jgi:hypothetical protein
MNNDLDQIEEELKEEEEKTEKTHHKVSGKSVFQLQEIIASRGNSSGIIKKKSKKERDGSSSGAVEEND